MLRIFILLLLTANYSLIHAGNAVMISPVSLNKSQDIAALQSQKSSEKDPVILIQLDQPNLISNADVRLIGEGWLAINLSTLKNVYSSVSRHIKSSGWLLPEAKISHEFQHNPEFAESWSENRKLDVHLYYYGADDQDVRSIILKYGATILSHYPSLGIFRINTTAIQLKALLSNTCVMYATPTSKERTPLANLAITMNRVNVVNKPAPQGLGLKGNGIGIGVWDFGAAGNHVDLDLSVENIENTYFNATGSQHTTLVSGAIAGRGVLRQDILGVAPESKVYVHNFFGDIINEMRTLYSSKTVRVTNHSYNVGNNFQCFVPYAYDAVSSLLDDYVREKPDMVNVYAAGNSATLCAYNYSTIVPGFQYAKNIITVGYLQNDETLYPGSARGPTNDGRLRPEIMAKGASTFTPSATGIILTNLNQNYAQGFGSSFASPQVTGIVALLQQAALNVSNPYPSASLVKAILCNTAKDLGNAGPDYSNGFGRVDAFKAITAYQNDLYLEDTIADGSKKSFNINVPSGTAQLKVTLCWSDPATLLPATKILTNDLDLTVVKGSDTTLPWILNPGSPAALAIRGRDSLNNIEQVTLDAPVPGSYTIVVNGFDIPDGPQDFSISYYFESEGAQITYPNGGEVVVAGSADAVRWEAMQTDSLLEIEYSLNGGSTWTSIGTVPASKGFISWTVPSVFSDSALIRLRSGVVTWAVSDTLFTIMGRPTSASLLQCNNGIRIGWSTITGATAYVISRYVNDTWVDLDTATVSPYFITDAIQGLEYILSVRPITSKVDGPRMIATRLTPRPSNCSFAATDLGLTAVRPISGRQLTATALSSTMPLQFKVQNFRNAVANFSVTMSWQVNGGAVEDSVFNINVPSNGAVWFKTNQTFDFSGTGNYSVKAWISAASDTRKKNDTIVKVIRQLDNAAMTLPYAEGFETNPFTESDSAVGLPGLDKYDFYPVGTARVNTFGSQVLAPQGKRAITIDNYFDNNALANGNFISTYNLSNYTDSTVYLDFTFRRRGELTGTDSLYVRGSDSDIWINVLDFLSNSSVVAEDVSIERINLSEILFNKGQSFSTSTQLRYRVETLRSASTIVANGGYTFDDVKLFSPGTDAALLNIDFENSICVSSLEDSIMLDVKVLVKNNFVDSLLDVELFFRVGDTTLKLAEVDFSAFEEKEIDVILPLKLDSAGRANFDCFIFAADDLFRDDDTLSSLNLRGVEIIPSLPYYHSFELDNDPITLTVDGNLASWQRGFPNKSIIDQPAEGLNAWVTSLSGNYVEDEKGALYLGCFDPADIDSNGQIAFEHIFQTEANYDWVTLEYSQNGGKVWQPLGRSNNGFNWFNNVVTPTGWEGLRDVWQVASYPLSADSFPSVNQVVLRLVMNSDLLEVREGFAIDDFRILRKSPAITDNLVNDYYLNSAGTGLIPFLNDDDKEMAVLDDGGQNLGNVRLNITPLSNCLPVVNNRNILARKFYFESDNTPSTPVSLRLFITNQEYLNLVAADTTVKAMRQIGAMLYNGINADASIFNNTDTNYSFIPSDSLLFLPYSNGYEVVLDIPYSSTEIYLCGTQNVSAPVLHLVMDTLPLQIELDSLLNIFQVRLNCLGNNLFSSCSDGFVTLIPSVCGVKGVLTQPVINGIATFDSLLFSRGPIQDVSFKAVYVGNCSDTLEVISNYLDVRDSLSAARPLPQINLSDQSVCADVSKGIDVSYQYVDTPAVYIWSPSLFLNDSSSAVPIYTPGINQTYQLIVVDQDACSDTAVFNMDVLDLPLITAQPKNASACLKTFSVVATGSSLTYQWQRKISGIWTDISPADTNFIGSDSSILEVIYPLSLLSDSLLRCLITESGQCVVVTDSVQYAMMPVIDLPSTGTYTGDRPCDEGLWTYYGTSDEPGKFILAINWSPDNSLSAENALAKNAAIISLKVDDDYFGKDSIISGTPLATYTMRRYWNVDIDGEVISEPVQVKFYYALSEKQDIVQAVNDYISLHPGTVSEGLEWFKTISGDFNPVSDVQAINVKDAVRLNNLNTTDTTENGVLYALLDSVLSFSGGTLAAGVGPLSSPLPVELLFFNGKCNGQNVELNWATASELNADYFEIYRSADGIDFTPIGRIAAAGYSGNRIDYQFMDSSSNGASAYYLLKQYDFDGREFVFKTVYIGCAIDLPETFNAYFHPSSGVVVRFQTLLNGRSTIRVVGVDGRILYQEKYDVSSGANVWVLPAEAWPSGAYVVELLSDGKVYFKKLVKY
jgi:hypothetical protein